MKRLGQKERDSSGNCLKGQQSVKVHTDGENVELNEKILDFLFFNYYMKFGFGTKLSCLCIHIKIYFVYY